VDTLRAELLSRFLSIPVGLAREAAAAHQTERARAFVDLVDSAGLSAAQRDKAIGEALEPLLERVTEVAKSISAGAADRPHSSLISFWVESKAQVDEISDELARACPPKSAPSIDGHDELALCLVKLFENLHDRAQQPDLAIDALRAARDLAGSEGLRAELTGKTERFGG